MAFITILFILIIFSLTGILFLSLIMYIYHSLLNDYARKNQKTSIYTTENSTTVEKTNNTDKPVDLLQEDSVDINQTELNHAVQGDVADPIEGLDEQQSKIQVVTSDKHRKKTKNKKYTKNIGKQ